MKNTIIGGWIVIAIIALGLFVWKSDKQFVLGLDLAGGSALTYTIHTETLPEGTDIEASVDSLRDVIERRINLFGVREPSVTTAYSRLANEYRLIIELPGVTDVKAAAKLIGETPVLEFRTIKKGTTGTSTLADFETTQLTGTYLKKSSLVFDQTTSRPIIELAFDDKGSELFAQITKENIGKPVGIFLDGQPISIPNVNEEITGGKAVITGDFSVEEAKLLVGRLNSGALPVPITPSGTSIVEASLGTKAVGAGVKASILGFILISLFMLLWYRLPGLLAVVALIFYTEIMLVLFKYIPVTLTSAGLAGFIISLGLAVDANVLTFERMKEELRDGKGLRDALEAGFVRAWTSIRDSHIAAIIVSIILFWFGTSIVKGFAFTFFLGAVVSLFSAQVITRSLLRAVAVNKMGKLSKFLFGSGIK